MTKSYGYVRVSTKEQKEDRQMIAMKELKIPIKNIYVDKISGKNFDRPMYKKLIRRLKENDVLYITLFVLASVSVRSPLPSIGTVSRFMRRPHQPGVFDISPSATNCS